MAIDYTALFTNWGHALKGIIDTNTYRGTDLVTRINLLRADFASVDRDLADNFYATLASAQGSVSGLQSAYRTMMEKVLIRKVTTDKPLITQSVASCMAELYAQMVADGESIDRPTVSGTVTAGSGNVGDTVCVSSVLLGDGRQNDMVIAETVTLLCSADSYQGSATAYTEPFPYSGAASVDGLSWLWPAGSGGSGSVNTTNAATDGIVTEGDFEGTWTPANTPPTPWVVTVGTIGTTVLQAGGSNALRGSKSLEIAGNSAQLTQLRQPLTNLRPRVQYAFNIWYRLSGASPAAGVMAMRLVDQDGTVVADNQSANNTTSVTLSGVGDTDWHALNAMFRLPDTLPTTLYLEIILTTALTTGTSVYIDLVQGVAATELYASGPYVALFSGGTPATRGDTFSIAYANNEGVASFVRGLDRVFNMRSLRIQLPSNGSGSETISDSLIV